MTTIIDCADCDEQFVFEGWPHVLYDMAEENGWRPTDDNCDDYLCPECVRRRKIRYAEQADPDIV